MLKLIVNKPFYRVLNREGGQLNYWISEEGVGNFELIWAIASPREEEIEAFIEGEIEFRLAVVKTIPFFCFRVIHNRHIVIPFNECPFNVNLIDGGRMHFELIRVAFSSDETLRLSMPLIVIDYLDNIIKHLAFYTLSTEFSRKLLEAILSNQINNEAEYTQTLEEIYRTYPVGEIANRYSIIKCKAGE